MELSDILNLLVVSIALITIISQIIQSRRTTDFAYQPEFEVRNFCSCGNCKWTPKLCIGSRPYSTNKCKKDHWFVIKNCNSNIAFNVEIYFFHKEEIVNSFNIQNYRKRLYKSKSLFKNVDHQYKLAQGEIPLSLYNSDHNDDFFIIIKYKTISNYNKFVQIIQLQYEPKNKSMYGIQDWKENIEITHSNTMYFERFGFLKRVNYNKLMVLVKDELCEDE